jgi:predicted enzyme related to lactoylglutathione lyase
MIQLGSLNLIVKDIRAAERFYAEVLGLKVDPERTNRPSFVLLRAANCMVILQEAKSETVIPNADSPVEIAFEVDDLQAIEQRLQGRAAVQKMGWGNAIETTDPEGTRLNLYRWS